MIVRDDVYNNYIFIFKEIQFYPRNNLFRWFLLSAQRELWGRKKSINVVFEKRLLRLALAVVARTSSIYRKFLQRGRLLFRRCSHTAIPVSGFDDRRLLNTNDSIPLPAPLFLFPLFTVACFKFTQTNTLSPRYNNKHRPFLFLSPIL